MHAPSRPDSAPASSPASSTGPADGAARAAAAEVASARFRPTPGRRLQLLGLWAVGMVVALGRYLVHRVPFYRRNRRHDDHPAPPDLDRALPGDPTLVQRASEGVGALYHRAYRIAVTDADLDPASLIERLRRDLNAASPVEVATFDPVEVQDPERLGAGDEYVVRLPGPWSGPVRVVECTATSFTLATLRGHMEAGQIVFRAGYEERHGWLEFAIESWARSGDGLFDLLYDRLPIAREVQLHMWAHFCERVARLSGGVVMTNVELHTCKTDPEDAT